MDGKNLIRCTTHSTKRGLAQLQRLGLLDGTAHMTAFLLWRGWQLVSRTACEKKACTVKRVLAKVAVTEAATTAATIAAVKCLA